MMVVTENTESGVEDVKPVRSINSHSFRRDISALIKAHSQFYESKSKYIILLMTHGQKLF